MGVNAIPGPQVTFGLTRASTGGIQEYNEERGPNVSDCWETLADPRAAYCHKPGNPVGTALPGWWGAYGVVDCTPGTISTNAIALVTASPTAGTAITLSTVNNSVVTTGVQLTPATGGSCTVTVISLDSTYATAPRMITCGSAGTVRAWDPTTALSRKITISRAASQDGTAETWTIQGYDVYGVPVTETITGTSSTGGSQFVSNKTWKYIRSITPAGTITSTNVVIGVNDTYGFPLAVHQPCYVTYMNNVSTALNIVTAIASVITTASTATATSTTPDVRGTILSCAVGTASLSTGATPVRLFMRVTPAAQDVLLQSQTFLSSGPHMWLGVDQYSS